MILTFPTKPLRVTELRCSIMCSVKGLLNQFFDAASAPDGQPVKGREENTTRRCGDFPDCAIYPLQAAEVRKYLCINKWGSNPAEYTGASTASAGYSRRQWSMECRQGQRKGPPS